MGGTKSRLKSFLLKQTVFLSSHHQQPSFAIYCPSSARSHYKWKGRNNYSLQDFSLKRIRRTEIFGGNFLSSFCYFNPLELLRKPLQYLIIFLRNLLEDSYEAISRVALSWKPLSCFRGVNYIGCMQLSATLPPLQYTQLQLSKWAPLLAAACIKSLQCIE